MKHEDNTTNSNGFAAILKRKCLKVKEISSWQNIFLEFTEISLTLKEALININSNFSSIINIP